MPLALPVRRRDPFERQSRGGRMVADGHNHHQHPIAIGDVGADGIDRDWQRELSVIDADAPFVDQQLLGVLQQGALVSMENQATIVVCIAGDLDQDVLRLQSGHRGGDHQAAISSIHFDRNLLLLRLFVHLRHLPFRPLSCHPLSARSDDPSGLPSVQGRSTRSDLRPSPVIHGIFTRSALPVADGLVLGDQLDGAQILHHFVP